MPNAFNTSQSTIIDQDNRNMAASSSPGSMSSNLNAIWAAIDAGSIGITSSAADVDSLAKGGGAFTWDSVNYPGTSLAFGWTASRFHNGYQNVAVAAGSVTLAASSTNYVELDRNGTVYTNSSGFTPGRLPLYQIVTSGSGFSVATITSVKSLLTLIGPAGINGTLLSTAAATKTIEKDTGATISATTSFLVQSPNVACTLTAARFVNSTAVAANNTNYWSFSVVNKGSGAGSTNMLNTGAGSTTQATGGISLTAYDTASLPLNASTGATACNPSDCLLITLAATGSPTALTLGELALDFQFTA
jgi:hypothetical protein